MSAGDDSFGGTPVGPIDAVGPVGAAAVAYLRLWTDGAAAQAQVWNAFAVRLGPAEGRSALRTLERICDLCMRHGRRPLMLHQAGCRCLGADEACFATVVETAACGEREDALGVGDDGARRYRAAAGGRGPEFRTGVAAQGPS